MFVPTNVDYQLVHSFIVQSRSLDYLRQGLTPLLEWNLSWTPKFFIVDFSPEQISIIEELFPCKLKFKFSLTLFFIFTQNNVLGFQLQTPGKIMAFQMCSGEFLILKTHF